MDQMPPMDGDIEAVKRIVESGTHIDKIYNFDSITLLHKAARCEWLDIVKYLVNSGADINCVDTDGWTPLHYASNNMNLDIIKILVESSQNSEHGKCDVNALTHCLNTALHFASYRGHFDIVVYLLDAGVNPGFINQDGKTASGAARKRCYESIAEYIESYELMPTKGVFLNNEKN